MTIIPTDRSRLEALEKCPRKRYWQYEFQGAGLEKAGDLKLDARIGTWVHNGIERGVQLKATSDLSALDAGIEFRNECRELLKGQQLSEQQIHDIEEGVQIVTAVVYAWLKTVASRIRGEVLAIEKELTVDFAVGSDTVRLMARPDIIWRRKSDGTIFIRNLKTVRRADDRFREKWALDQQTLSEPLAVDEWLYRVDFLPAVELANKEGRTDVILEKCGGVIIDGLVTGEVLFDKYRNLFYHNNPLIYAWERGGIGVVETKEWYPRYEWTCTGPHKFANGRKCEGGATHKLSGVRKVPVADHYPGGIIAWIDYLIENYPDVVAECIVELPPIIRSEYQIERWKRQVLCREKSIHDATEMFTEGWYTNPDEWLDVQFPMHTSNGNCLYPGKCMAYDLCHGSAAADPLASGLYQRRVPNHPQESEKTEQP